MEAQQAKARKFVLNYGLLLGIIMVTLGVVMYVTNNHIDPHWSFMVISFAIFIAVVIYGIKAYKNENGGFLSLGEAIKVAVGIGLIAALLGGTWNILLAKVIEPDYAEQMADFQREQMVERYPEMTDTQINQAMEMSANFSSPWIGFATVLVMYMLFGLVVGLVAGLVMKEKRPYEV